MATFRKWLESDDKIFEHSIDKKKEPFMKIKKLFLSKTKKRKNELLDHGHRTIRSLNIFNPCDFLKYGITWPHVRPSQWSQNTILLWNRPVLMRVGHFHCIIGHFYFLSAIFVVKSTTLALKMTIFDLKSASILVKLAWEFSKIFILGFSFFHFCRKSIVTNCYEIGYFCCEIDRFWFESAIFIAKSAIYIIL